MLGLVNVGDGKEPNAGVLVPDGVIVGVACPSRSVSMRDRAGLAGCIASGRLKLSKEFSSMSMSLLKVGSIEVGDCVSFISEAGVAGEPSVTRLAFTLPF